MPRGNIGSLLLPAPLAAVLVASHDALAAQTAFCTASGLVFAAIGAERWLSDPAARRGGSRPGQLAAALCPTLVVLAGAVGYIGVAELLGPASTVASGFRVAGYVGLAAAAALLIPGLPTSMGRLALNFLAGRVDDHVGWAAGVARGVALRVVAFVAAGFLLLGWRAALAASAATVLLVGQVEREARRQRLARRTVAEIAEPVADLPALPSAPHHDLERLRSVGYGVVQHDSSPRLVRYRDVAALPADVLADRAWWRLGKTAPVINGARALEQFDAHPSNDEVWLVQAGDLVVGVLTAASLRRSQRGFTADDASCRRRPDAARGETRPACPTGADVAEELR